MHKKSYAISIKPIFQIKKMLFFAEKGDFKTTQYFNEILL